MVLFLVESVLWEVVMCGVFVVLWEALSAAAWGMSSSEMVQRSAAEWEEAGVLESCGSLAEAERCVVRAEVWESLAEEVSVHDAWERVVCMVEDWREGLPAGSPGCPRVAERERCVVAGAPVVGCAGVSCPLLYGVEE